MKAMVYSLVVRTLTWFLARLSDNPKLLEQNMDASMTTLELLWQTPAIHRYLDWREQMLREQTTEAVLNAQVPDAKFLGGRMKEIRELRDKLRAAHVYMERKRREMRLQQPAK